MADAKPGSGRNDQPHAETSGESVPATFEPESLSAVYANFVRVSGTPEELVLDFGLNTHGAGAAAIPVKVSQRLVLNHYTAKRLWLTLGAALQRHEQLFGQLEIDINKRVLPSAKPSLSR